MTSVPVMAHNSSRRCQSWFDRAKREASREKIAPTWPRATSLTRALKSSRPVIRAPDWPRSRSGSPDESGSKRREKGLSRSGNARVRKIMIQLAWRMVKFQPDSALVQWFKQRTENAKGSRKPMIVALARKLIIALWRYANDGVIPEGFRLHSAA